ncbi:hypothetical protein KBI23_02810 [bacterium]|nr:hypothetical protein [bacterium]MBP9808068.1 hypothetical protein [bacterium]
MTTVRAAADNKRCQLAKQLGCLLAVQFGLGLVAQSAFAEDVAATSSPSTQASSSNATSTAVPASQAAPAAPATPVSAATIAPASSAAVPVAAPAPAAAANDGPLVEPGPAEAKRTALVLRIFNAKAQGIGIDAYLNAFAMLENSVKTGETEANLNKRIDSLNSSLDDQLKRSAVLKTQRPAPPVAASGFPAGGLGGGGSSGGGTSDLIRKLQEKYGDQIPSNLKDKLGAGGQIPDNLKDKIPAGLGGLDPSQIEDLIKKYKK